MNKLLVIEDQKDLCSMFDLILLFHGFDVTVVDNGRKAMVIVGLVGMAPYALALW